MKTIFTFIRSAAAHKTWVVTIANDYGQTIQHTCRARTCRAALRKAYSLTDSDWYSVTVHMVT